MNKSLLLLLMILAEHFSVGLCQITKDTVKLKEVFVTSARQVSERAIYFNKIDSIVLVKAVNSDLSDLLLKNSSIYIKSYGVGALATASFRGTSASHTQVLWNGLNINSPLWGQSDLSLLPVFFTDEVSLFYGSSSMTKTSGGLGGCISMNNIPAWNGGTKVSLSQTNGSFGYNLSQLKFSISKNRFISNTRLFFDESKNDFKYYDNASGLFNYTRQKNADYKKTGYLQEFYYKLGQRQFTGIKIMNMWSDRNLPAIMGYSGAEKYENQKDNLLNIIGEWKYYSAKSNLTFNTGFIRNSLNYVLSNNLPEGILINYNTRSVSNVFSNKLIFQYNISDKTIIKTSADANNTNAQYLDKTDNSGFNVHRNDLALQSTVHKVFSPLLSGYILGQQKLLDGVLMPFTAAAGMEYVALGNNQLVFKTNIGRNLHVPNLNDKYFKPGGNAGLKPEIGYQGDAGLQWNNNFNEVHYQLEITGYAAWIDNWILWQPSQFRYWTANNVQQVFSRGTEINVNLKGDPGFLKYNLKGNYSFTRTTNEEKESPAYRMQLIYIPKHIGNINLFLEKERITAVISWHFTGSRYASTVEDKVHKLDPYYLMDLGLGKTFRLKQNSLDLNFRLNNILNKQYQVIEFRAMPGINYSMSLGFNFTSN